MTLNVDTEFPASEMQPVLSSGQSTEEFQTCPRASPLQRQSPQCSLCTFCFSEWLLACLAASASNCSYCLWPWYSRTRFSCTQARSGWLLKNCTWYSRAPEREKTPLSTGINTALPAQIMLSSSPAGGGTWPKCTDTTGQIQNSLGWKLRTPCPH